MSKNTLPCLQWLKYSIHLPTVHQAASESVVFMLISMDTVTAEEVDISMAEVVAEGVEEEVDEVEEDTPKKVVESAAHSESSK